MLQGEPDGSRARQNIDWLARSFGGRSLCFPYSSARSKTCAFRSEPAASSIVANEMNPKDPAITAQINEAKRLVDSGNPQAAMPILKTLYQSSDNNEDISCMLGVVNMQMNNNEAARACFQKAIAINHDNPLGDFYLAELYARQQKTQDAIDSYMAALKKNKTPPFGGIVCFKLGVVFQHRNELDQAVNYYNKCLQFQPGNAVAWYNLAIIYHGRNDLGNAERCLRKAVDVNPKYLAALNNLGSLLTEANRPGEAKRFYKMALDVDPASTQVMLNLADVLFNNQMFDEAMPYYEKLTELEPGNFAAWKGLGNTCRVKKETGRAIRAYKKALALKPDSRGLQYQLTALCGSEHGTPQTAPAEYVTGLFDSYADRFDKHLVEVLQYKTPEVIFDSVTACFAGENNGQDILDLGCGTGLCGKLFQDRANTLIGVDLSEKMIEQARLLGCYSELVVGDIGTFLENKNDEYTIILSADVFVYIGDLETIFIACQKALKAGGLFAFSVEAEDSAEDYVLRKTGRYAHSRRYIRRLAENCGLTQVSFKEVIIRTEDRKPIQGYAIVLEKQQQLA